MATLQSFVVDTDGSQTPNYTSLSAFESNEEANLVSLDKYYEVTTRATAGAADTSEAVFSNWTTDGTRYLHIFCDEDHGTSWSTSTYRIEVSSSYNSGISLASGGGADDVILDNLQVQVAKDLAVGISTRTVAAGEVEVRRCRVRQTHATPTSASYGIYAACENGKKNKIGNNIVWDFHTGFRCQGNASGTNSNRIHNNTAADCTVGFYGWNWANNHFINNVGWNNGTDFDAVSTTGSTTDYNASKDTTAPGTNAQTSISDPFVNSATGDYYLDTAGTDCVGNGTDLNSDSNYAITRDANDRRYPGPNFDIGAYQTANKKAYVVDPDSGTGYTHTGMKALEADLDDDADMVDRNQWIDVELQSTSPYTADHVGGLTFSPGFVTSPEHCFNIWCDSDHGGEWNTSMYRSWSSTTWAQGWGVHGIRHTTITGLQHETQRSNCYGVYMYSSTGGDDEYYTLERVFVKHTTQTPTSTATGFRMSSNARTCHYKLSNCIVDGFYDNYSGGSDTDTRIHSCTSANAVRYGFTGSGDTDQHIRNCVSYGSGTNDFEPTDQTGQGSTSSNNASGDTTAPGTSAKTSIADPFVNSAGGDFHLDGTISGGCVDTGVDLSLDANLPVTVDAANVTRTGTWDIGAHQVTAAASKTARITATQADVTYTEKTARVTATQADTTYTEKTARVTATQADTTYSEITARVTAIDADATHTETTARVTAIDADATHSEITARVTAIDADSTYSEIAARVTAIDAGIEYTPDPSARVTAIDAGITYSTGLGKTLTPWQRATLRRNRPEAMFVQILTIDGGVRIFNIGEAATVEEFDNTIGENQPGVLEWGDMAFEGSPSDPGSPVRATFRLRNTTFSDGVAGNTANLLTDMQSVIFLGAQVTVKVAAKGDTNWLASTMFVGVIQEVNATESYVEITAEQASDESIQVPTYEINRGMFIDDDATYTYRDDWTGSPVPIGYGRFDMTARETFASGHPLYKDPKETLDTGAAAMFPAYCGIKIPMMPLVLGVDLWQGTFGVVGDEPRVAIYLQGDRTNRSRGTLPIEIEVATNRASRTINQLFPKTDVHGDEPPTVAQQTKIYYNHLFTWNEELDRAIAFRTDKSNGVVHQVTGGAGDAAVLQATWFEWTGQGREVFGSFINRTAPDAAEGDDFTGALQSVALFSTQQSSIVGPACYSPQFEPANSWTFGTSGTLINPRDTLFNDDFSDVYNIPASKQLSIHMAASGPHLGDIFSTAFCWLSNSATSSDTALDVAARYAPYGGSVPGPGNANHGLPLFPGWNTAPVVNSAGLLVDATAGTFFQAVGVRRKVAYIQRQPDDEVVAGASTYPGVRGYIGEWNFTHTDINAGGTLFGPFQTDFAWFTSAGGDLDLVFQWFDVVYRAQLGSTLNREPGTFSAQLLPELLQRGRQRFGAVISPSVWSPARFEKFEATFETGQPANIGGTRLFCTGQGPIDDSSGTYTGTGATGSLDPLVERPPDIAGHLISNYLGATPFNNRATSTDFGSFETARTLLNNDVTGDDWVLSLVVDSRTTLADVLQSIGAQSKSFFQKQVDANGTERWRVFVDDPDPATNDPKRMFREDGNLWKWDDLVQDSLRVTLTPLSAIANQFVLRYGFHRPSHDFAYSMFCNENANDLLTGGSTYQTACATSQANYNVKRNVVFDAPDVWRPEVAEALLKWFIDQRRERRVMVEFDAYINAADIRPGHVITMDDEIGDRLPFPGLFGAGTWSSHQFNVVSSTVTKDPESPIRVHVVALETYTKAT